MFIVNSRMLKNLEQKCTKNAEKRKRERDQG